MFRVPQRDHEPRVLVRERLLRHRQRDLAACETRRCHIGRAVIGNLLCEWLHGGSVRRQTSLELLGVDGRRRRLAPLAQFFGPALGRLHVTTAFETLSAASTSACPRVGRLALRRLELGPGSAMARARRLLVATPSSWRPLRSFGAGAELVHLLSRGSGTQRLGRGERRHVGAELAFQVADVRRVWWFGATSQLFRRRERLALGDQVVAVDVEARVVEAVLLGTGCFGAAGGTKRFVVLAGGAFLDFFCCLP